MLEPVFNPHFQQLLKGANIILNGTTRDLPFSKINPNENEKPDKELPNADYIIKSHQLAKQLNVLFPGAFLKKEFTNSYQLSWFAKLNLKQNNIQFNTNEAKETVLTTFVYHPTYLYMQLLHYTYDMQNTISKNTLAKSIKSWKKPKCHLWLDNNLVVGYSHGRLIDFADQLYDEYKHTQLPPMVFRNIFFSFLQYTPEIGNLAFDNYTESRDTQQAWEKAILHYLTSNFTLSPMQSKTICTDLFKNN